MSFQSINTANVKYKNGVMYITGNTRITQQNVYLTSGNFSKGAPIVNPNHRISSTPAPTGLQGTSYISKTITPVPNYIIGDSLGLTTYTFEVTNGTGDTLYTNGTYTVSASSLVVSGNPAKQITNLFNNISGNGWQSDAYYYGATVSNCSTYTGTKSTLVNGTTYLGEWCQIQFPYCISITSFKYFTVFNAYGRIALVGSTDGSNWANIYVEATNINNGGTPTGNGVYTTLPTTSAYVSYIRLIALVGQNSCADHSSLILKGNINIGNTTPGYIANATYGTIGNVSVIINLTGAYTSFNVVRTNITAGNTIVTYYGLTGSSYTDSTVSSNTNYSYSIVPVNYIIAGTVYSVGSITTLLTAPVLATSTTTNYTKRFVFTPLVGSDILYTATTNTGISGTSTTSPIIIYGLTKSTSYTATLTASNSFGTSPPSNSLAFTTTSALPSVTALALVSSTPNSITVSFGYPFNAQSYTVYTTIGGFSATSTTSPITIGGLSATTTYSLYIVSYNEIGNSANSANFAAKTKINSPTNLSLITDPFGNSFTIITYTPPSGTITNYTCTLNTGTIVTSTSTNAWLSGLFPNISYSVNIVANTFAYGSSPPATLSFTIPDTIYIYSGTLSTLYGWTTSALGATIVNNALRLQSYSFSTYCYINLGVSILGKTIEFDYYLLDSRGTSDLLFGCDSYGTGNYLRIGNKLGFGKANSWTSLGATATENYTTPTNYTSVHRYKLAISDAGTLTLYIDNNLKTITSGSYTPIFKGTYVGFNGDQQSSSIYGFFSNLSIY
jgi:hypothetical protein